MRGQRPPRKIDVIKYQSNIIAEQQQYIDYLLDIILKNIRN